jgi:hypothetical protein
MTAPFLVKDAVDALIDEKTIEHLDFDPRCQVIQGIGLMVPGAFVPISRSRCLNPSAWVATCRGCAALTFVCEYHYALSKNPAWIIGCGKCQLTGPVEDVFTYSPVRS